ncbi:MAG: hypothetical protein HUU37_05230 [Bdellovibrionales bacterium]|nr:hypothetical protein [Bdellovibrionales bacterium]
MKILLLLFAFSAAADDKVIVRKTERHQFSGSSLRGKLKKPDLSYIYRRQGLRAEKILKIPDDFNEEIQSDASQF